MKCLNAVNIFWVEVLLKCFNFCLAHGLYPRSWPKGYIVPIHKAGDPTIPSYYRGITIASAVGKVFNSILNDLMFIYSIILVLIIIR